MVICVKKVTALWRRCDQVGFDTSGFDPVALDTTVCNIIAIDPKKVFYIAKAAKKNLGTTDSAQCGFLGEPIESVKYPFKMPKMYKSISFDPKKCKQCGTCWKNCPMTAIMPPAILKSGRVPKWDQKKCIMCYCCAELCPYEAVNFKINLVKR